MTAKFVFKHAHLEDLNYKSDNSTASLVSCAAVSGDKGT